MQRPLKEKLLHLMRTITTNILYIFGIVFSKMPTLKYGALRFNPTRAVWVKKFNQNYFYNVWFSRYPNELNVKSIGKGTYSKEIMLETPIIEFYLGSYTSIAGGLKIIHADSHSKDSVSTSTHVKEMKEGTKCKLIIGNDVWIGEDVMILVPSDSTIIIGDGAILAARSVVTKSVENYAVYGGVPAKIIKYRFDKRTINSLLKIKWWEWPQSKIDQNLDLFDDPKAFCKKFDI